MGEWSDHNLIDKFVNIIPEKIQYKKCMASWFGIELNKHQAVLTYEKQVKQLNLV